MKTLINTYSVTLVLGVGTVTTSDVQATGDSFTFATDVLIKGTTGPSSGRGLSQYWVPPANIVVNTSFDVHAADDLGDDANTLDECELTVFHWR